MTQAWRSARFWIASGALVFLFLGVNGWAQEQDKQPKDAQPPAEQQPAAPQPAAPQPAAPQPAAPQPAAPTPTPTGGGGGVSALLGGLEAAAPSPTATNPTQTPGGQIIPGGASATAYNAPDVGRLLTRSDESLGIQNQFRNAVIADPRIRGYHVGQITTYGDGGYFVPARLDLDTIVSKFDPTTVRNVSVLKGPYSVRYGPGFAFLDISTFDSPRSEPGTYVFHERTVYGYNTNGQGMNGLQMLEFGAPDYGIRATYDIRVSNDYKAGEGRDVPSSYNSESGVFAAGFSFSDISKIEFHAVRLYQHDVEFPGLFFDLNRLDTEAYSVRYSLNDKDSLHQVYVDLWYNFTGANGDTHQGAKQAFVNNLIGNGFTTNPAMPATVHDFSNTNFSEQSRGYRLTWAWGDNAHPQIGIGTDMNIVSQRLEEHIRFQPLTNIDVGGIRSPDGSLTLPDSILGQDLGIPVSRSVDFGFFLDGALPVGDRLTFRAGMRGDWVRASSDPRLIVGNILLSPGTVSFPGVPPIPGVPPTPDQTTVNPIIFSSNPNDPNLTRHFGLFAAYVNGEYKIDEHLTAQLGFGHAERPPTLTELYADGPFIAVLQQGPVRFIGDPHLDPENLQQVDVGIKGRWDRVRAGANGFYAFIDKYITFDLQKGGGSQIAQVVATNTDEATLAGGEAYIEVDAGDWVTPFSTLSYVQGKDLTHLDTRRPAAIASSRRLQDQLNNNGSLDTEPLPGIPPLELRNGFRVHEPSKQPRWAVEFTARTVFAQNEVASSLGEVPTGSFTVFDIRSYWQVNPNLLLVSGVENLGDKFYREHLDPISGPAFFTPAGTLGPPHTILFRPGFNYYLTVQLYF
jgi:outer membrane receptor protein involved in Fe transport